MAEGADAQHYGHLLFLARLDELAKISVAAPVPLAFFFLVMNPEHVGGKDGDAASPHLLNLASPLPFGHTAVVHLAHHGQHVLATYDEASAIDLELHAVGIDVSAETKSLLCHSSCSTRD